MVQISGENYKPFWSMHSGRVTSVMVSNLIYYDSYCYKMRQLLLQYATEDHYKMRQVI